MVSLYDDVLVLTADWTRLQTLMLRDVCMSVRSWSPGWGRFVSSLLTVPHPVDVTLRYTDIDDDTVGRILTYPDFTVTEDSEVRDGGGMYKMLKFTLYWGEGGIATQKKQEMLHYMMQ